MRARTLLAALAVGASLVGCRSTVDILGSRDGGGPGDGGGVAALRPLTGPASYPNPFRDVLGKSEAEISAKIMGAFDQLFHGDNTETIYFGSGPDAAYIRDILHDDIRTEGMGYGMMAAVQVNARTEFDRLWTYAKTMLRVESGANEGYFHSSCDGPGPAAACIDPFGYQMFTMALIFAHDRWVRPGSGAAGTDGGPGTDARPTADAGGDAGGDARPAATAIDYQADALALLQVMRHKEEQNGGIVDGVTNTFDADTKLAFDYPNQSVGNVTRPSIEMPAYYALWGQATGDTFWGQAASAARAHWKKAAHPTTGLLPVRATFEGMPVAGSDNFGPEVYRTQISITLDRIWGSADTWPVEENNRLLQFFTSKGMSTYGKVFSLDGTMTVESPHDPSLVVTNGASAAIATVNQAEAFIAEVWNLPTPTGNGRYYTGLLDLMALLILGGQYRIY